MVRERAEATDTERRNLTHEIVRLSTLIVAAVFKKKIPFDTFILDPSETRDIHV